MTPTPSQNPVALEAQRMTVWRDCLSLASFWPPDQVGPQPAWLEHAPFAFWLIEALHPRTLVELGTHGGFSYFTLCQAVHRLQLETRCFAVDTWRGDEHAGFYGDEVFEDVRRYHDRRYSSFSTLVRATFDDAVHQFPDGIIDLLHIDGRHLYDDVKHDFEIWRPKLSDRSVVLFHDTNVHERDFGVVRFWRELRVGHRHFEFLHGHGLGVLGIGDRLPPAIDALLRASEDAKAETQIRGVYSRVGSTVTLELVALEQKRELRQQESELRQWKVQTDALRKDISLWTEGAEALRKDQVQRIVEAEALRSELRGRTEEAEALRTDLTRWSEEAQTLRTDQTQRIAEAEALRSELRGRTAEGEALRSELRGRTAEGEALRSELRGRTAEAEALRSELRGRTAEAEALRNDLTRWSEEAQTLRTNQAQRTEEAEALRSELRGRTEEAEVLRNDLTRWSEEAQTLRTDQAQRTEEAEALRSELRGRTAEAEALRNDLTRWSEETQILRRDQVQRTEEVEALRSELRRRTEEAEALRSDLARRAGEAETLRRTRASVTAENAQLVSELAATRRGVTEMQTTLAARSAEADRGEAELSDARQQIDELSRALEAQRLEAHVMRTSTSWQITRPIRDVRQSYPRLADHIRRTLRRLNVGAGVDERGPVTDVHTTPWRDFEGDFLEPYFRSAGFTDPPVVTAGRLREAGWPVYGTRAAVDEVAAAIRGSELFDVGEYASQLGQVSGIDPLLHYVIVGERMGLMPSKRFDPAYYRQRYPDVGKARMNLLAHYVTFGRTEGRRPLSVAAGLHFDRSRIDPERETILLITHEASRSGAPIVTHNIARRLGRKYNVVAVLLTGGELVPHFHAVCAAVIGPLTHADWHPVEAAYLVKQLTASYRVFMAIANSIESRIMLPALGYHMVPVVTLVHEFASYTRPEGTMGKALDWSTQVVFSAELVAQAAQKEHPTLVGRPIHVLPQGRCDVPARLAANGPPVRSLEDLDRVFRPKGAEGALVVLGCGTVHLRKGVDLFLACAAAVAASRTRRPVRFIWIGHGYDPRRDVAYSCYLAEQIARSGLEGSVQFLDELDDLEPAYRLSDVFFLSSRLDPLPNVTIDAAFLGIPVVCFADATGIGEVLGVDPSTRRCVVPHLDVAGAAKIIAEFANDEEARREVGATTRRLAEAAFDMDRYVDRIDQLGMEAVRTMRQRARDFDTIREDALFDERVSIPTDHPSVTRDEAIIGYLARWTAVNQSGYAATNELFRRPCAGFHPQVYAHERLAQYDAASPNPLADFIRRGKPPGPWSAELIVPAPRRETLATSPLRVALHGHFFYPELATDFMRKVAVNRWPCHLLLSTDTEDKAAILREASAGYLRGEVLIRVVPNRGRDLGPLLTAYAAEVASQYDIIGHLHGKRSLLIADPKLGENWREFLWQHLLGDLHPMMDIILDRLVTDESLGLVFAADPHLSDWDANLAMATDLADRIAILGPLPPFFDFPIGTMFWARSAALSPLLELKLGWDDYPPEPVSNDGTILHALERLLPFVARRGGYGYATTHIPGLTW